MSATDLQTPIIDGAIRSINFFNGRLLSARDLTLEQSAYREADRRLGKAIGEGIAYGLEVAKPANFKKESPALSVDAGLAINRQGHTLMLRARTEVALVRTSTHSGTSKGFGECLPLQTGAYVTGAGVYLLTIAPAQTSEGRAVTSAINPATTTCNTDTLVSAVQFRLIQIDSALTPGELQDQNHLRNLVAYKCFGITDQVAFVKDVFGGQWKKYGIVDNLRPLQLTDCEVPLAVLSWTDADGVKFVDNWSVRRPLVRYLVAGHDPVSADETSPSSNDAMVFASRTAPYVDERRAGEGLAMLLQFQEQLFTLVNTIPNPQNFIATNAFRWLPAAGLLPLRTTTHPLGFTYEKFFGSKIFAPPTPIDGAKLSALLTESLHYAPIDLNGTERIQLYTVTENTPPAGTPNPPQPYLVFASEEIPYYSTKPRFSDLCQTLRETRAAYRNFIVKNVFLGNVTSPGGLTARLSVMAALQAVMNAADQRHVAACRSNSVLTLEQALAIMQDLYEVQTSLFNVMTAPWGNIGVGGMPNYAALLKTYLDTAIPGGKTALGPAITAQNFQAALDAQNAINGLNANWSGEVVTGNLDVKYQQSDRGLVLKIGDTTPFKYTFRVWNKTNKALEVQLTAGFTDRETWNSGVTIENFPGAPGVVSLQPFDPGDPNDPAAFTDVVVVVTTPESGTLGQTGNLRLLASAPAPAGVFNSDSQILTIGSDIVAEPAATVALIGTVDVDGSPGAAPVGDDVLYTFHVRFHTTTPPTTRDFRAAVVYVSPPNAAALYFVGFNKAASTDPAHTNTTQKSTGPYPLTDNITNDLIVTIRPQAGSVGHALTFKVRVQSVLDNQLVVESQNFTVNPVSN